MTDKICSTCKILKDIKEFWKCKSEKDGYQHSCKDCRKRFVKKYLATPNGHKKTNELSLKFYNKIKDDPEHIKKRKISNSKYNKWRTKYNTEYRLKKLLQRRMLLVLRGTEKSAPTMKLIGCSIEQLKNHLQQTAIKNGYSNFNINDYNTQKYHIDHIKPCASFDLTNPEHQKECFNYNNLQILDAFTNISLSNKIKES